MRHIIYRFKTLLCATVLVLSCIPMIISCNKSDGVGGEPMPISDHTLLVYLAGDNNLYKEVIQKIDALKDGWSKDFNGRMLIYSDMKGENAQLLEVFSDRNGKTNIKTLEVFGSEDSASEEVFARVMSYLKNTVKSKTYGLLLFSHGSGWLPKGAYNKYLSNKSIIIDGSNDMDVSVMSHLIPDGMFEYIIFEACYMGGIEVLYELKDDAKYIMASPTEIISPGFTPVYGKMLKHLFVSDINNIDITKVAEEYFNHYNGLSGNYQSATISVVKTSEMKGLLNAAAKLPYRIHTSEDDLSIVQNFTRPTYKYLFVDYANYVFNFLDNELLYNNLKEKIDNLVIYKANTKQFILLPNGYVINNYCGISIYPYQDYYYDINVDYLKTHWMVDLKQQSQN